MELTDYTYKFRIYPTPEQEVKLAKHFGCVRWCYNHFLDKRVKHYMTAKEQDLEKKSLNYNDDAKALTELKQETEWLNEVNSQSLQHALKHLNSGFNRFFKKLAKFPKFKSKNNKQSFRVPQHVKVENNKLYIVKFKEGIEVNLHIQIEGEIRNATITKNCAGQYHVSIGVQREIKKLEPNDKVIGIDLGIKTLATCSDGTIFENIRPYRTLQARRRILAKTLSRAIKGSKGREKARKKLAKLDNHIRNIRQNHLHKVSHKIVSENQTIIMEDLNVSGMMKNRKVSKSIWDCSLNELVRQIRYKSKWYGREFLQVSRWFPSSKTCSECGCINDGLTLSDREWKCPRCETLHDRDFNASVNIKRQGLNEHNRGNHGDSCLPWRKTSAQQGLPTGTEAPPSLAAGQIHYGMDNYLAGNTCLSQADFAGARLHYEQCLNHSGATWNLTQLNLLEGRLDCWPDPAIVPSGISFNGSWQESTKLSGKHWRGECVDELNVIADQGAGDMIIFLRYLPEVRKRVSKLTVVCHKSLHRLVKCFPCVDEVKEEISDGYVTTFMQIPPLLSNPINIPDCKINIPVDETIKNLVNSFSDGLKIGICWSGNPRHPSNTQRSFPKEIFYDMPEKIFNLQYGCYDSNFRSVNATFSDFYSTAQVIKQMDLVVTCSTSVSVLSLLLGVETWVVLDAVPYWVWQLNETTPWFPQARLFRQDKPGNWDSVMFNLKTEVLNWIKQKKLSD